MSAHLMPEPLPAGRTLLTIDCDWAVAPTALRESRLNLPRPGQPRETYEHVRYRYRDRPDNARHAISHSPEALLTALRDRGLPARLRACFTELHGGVRDSWADVLADAAHVICLDAHLDMYPTMPSPSWLPARGGGRVPVVGPIRSGEAAAGLPNHTGLHPGVVERVREAAWEQAWSLLLLEQMPRLTQFSWVVPDHFARGLAVGFPYPNAAWQELLDAGVATGDWRYQLVPSEQRIELTFLEPPLAGRRLSVSLGTLADCPSLTAVDADRVHVCRSPGFIPPAADAWVDALRALLA